MRSFLIVLAILAFSSMAFAGTIVTMRYNGAGGNSYNGVPSYPYNVSVNTTPESLMCISYNEHVTGRNLASNRDDYPQFGLPSFLYSLKPKRLLFLPPGKGSWWIEFRNQR